MKSALVMLAAVGVAMSPIAPAFAHGGEPHGKCKKGYVATDDHKCVKKP